MGLERKLTNRGLLTVKLEQALNWARSNALWPTLFGLACCAVEVTSGRAAYELSRLGIETIRTAPRQSDLLLVAGRVTHKMTPVLRQVYEQMPAPRWVIAVGDCAASGGVFNNYAVVQGVDQVLPVDVYVPGCPPRPEALAQGIARLQEQIRSEKLTTW
jgi:NADH-quinone oxidoreductase subunit B